MKKSKSFFDLANGFYFIAFLFFLMGIMERYYPIVDNGTFLFVMGIVFLWYGINKKKKEKKKNKELDKDI